MNVVNIAGNAVLIYVFHLEVLGAAIGNKQAKVEHCNSIINLLLKDGTKYTMDSFKKLMLDYGYRFSMNGRCANRLAGA